LVCVSFENVGHPRQTRMRRFIYAVSESAVKIVFALSFPCLPFKNPCFRIFLNPIPKLETPTL